MLDRQPQWILQPQLQPPAWFLQLVQSHVPASSGHFAAQMLWQRGIQDRETLAKFINPQAFQPSSPFEFGWEMQWAVERILHAAENGEKVAIWGDFDADGITSTSVLWDGLGQFFPQNNTPDTSSASGTGGGQLIYYIPNRLTESHGLNIAGIDRLAEAGITLIVTCDTGSTNLKEIEYAHQLGIDAIVTDHHTLPDDRPPVVAIINPRYLPADHPMAHLSGVAVAYKLIEALYLTEPTIPQQPLEELLDLVAIGLIADLVELKGDCRYLAQVGLKRLEKEFKQPPYQWRRPGVGRLLELCQKTGDRPTDISFGLGPRINAVSRIHGDASFCVELLTSRDRRRCEQFAKETELTNARRQELQKNVLFQANKKLEQIDLSTTRIIVLEDPQWPVGVLGLVAGQIAQEYARPTILLTTDGGEGSVGSRHRSVETVGAMPPCLPRTVGREGSVETVGAMPPCLPRTVGEGEKISSSSVVMARGSARSVNQIDLYQLVKSQEHLLDRFGGHPFAAGLSLPADNLPLFTEAINRQLRQQIGELGRLGLPTFQADIICTVEELGADLFRELKLLEPCGMGNPVPQILIQNCWFEKVWNRNIKDASGRKIRYIKTEFKIYDDSIQDDFASGFPGIWWGHYKEELPHSESHPETKRCDAIAELDFNYYSKKYELRLVAVREILQPDRHHSLDSVKKPLQILDYRHGVRGEFEENDSLNSAIAIRKCPSSWQELEKQLKSALKSPELPVVVLAYGLPTMAEPMEVLQQLVGIAKYLSQMSKTVSSGQLCEKLGISDRTLQIGLNTLTALGFEIIQKSVENESTDCLQFATPPNPQETIGLDRATINHFILAVQEEQFYRQYFCKVPISTIEAIAGII